MESQSLNFQQRSLSQQGYDYSPHELKELDWGLRFTPSFCMLLAIYGLVTQQPYVHFVLAVLGIIPLWFPAWNPFDVFYNHALSPLWHGVKLPPNPLPRRIACFMGGSMNIGIGLGFLFQAPTVAYGFAVILIPLQIIVITTHFCVASWMYEGLLKIVGIWEPSIPATQAKALLEQGGRLIDVRNPNEFAKGHLPNAMNIPLDQIDRHLEELKESCVVLYCQGGVSSQRAAQILKKHGSSQVYNLGAMSKWNKN